MKGFCIVCGNEIEIKMFCSGIGCRCVSMPEEAPVCSEDCFHELATNYSNYFHTGVEQVALDINVFKANKNPESAETGL